MSDLTVPNVFVPNWQSQQPSVDHLVPPVVLNIGNPIVDMLQKRHTKIINIIKSGLPVDRNLVEDDPDKAMIVCDATVPSYDAMNYEPEQLTIVREVEPPPVSPHQNHQRQKFLILVMLHQGRGALSCTKST